jgi:selT/selW/selH-like putative selenoprotein
VGGTVELVPGKVGQFDVEVEGAVIFSKARAGRFPEHDEVLDQLPG